MVNKTLPNLGTPRLPNQELRHWQQTICKTEWWAREDGTP